MNVKTVETAKIVVTVVALAITFKVGRNIISSSIATIARESK